MRVQPISLSELRPEVERGKIDTYTKRLDEVGGGRAKKTGNTAADTESRITADRACFFYHLVFAAFRSRERRKASNESEKELFYSVKYRRRARAAAFFLATEGASRKRGEQTTSELRFRHTHTHKLAFK